MLLLSLPSLSVNIILIPSARFRLWGIGVVGKHPRTGVVVWVYWGAGGCVGGIGECAADLEEVRVGIKGRGGKKRGKGNGGHTPPSVLGSGREESPVLENIPPTSFEELELGILALFLFCGFGLADMGTCRVGMERGKEG
jgi:hypothetical protein